jgi:hypothetical protein
MIMSVKVKIKEVRDNWVENDEFIELKELILNALGKKIDIEVRTEKDLILVSAVLLELAGNFEDEINDRRFNS